MPELPEVETTARGLRAVLVGRCVIDVDQVDWPRMLPNISPAELAAVLCGQEVASVDRRGKLLLLRLSGGGALTIHRKMSGNLILRPPGSVPAPHTHLILRFDQGPELHLIDPRKFGRVHYFADEDDLLEFLAARLGPEPLEGLSAPQLADLLRSRRRRLKPLLLDQSVLAGLGNLYADEALWLARLHPERSGASLTRPEARRLAASIRQVLEDAIARRGTSLSSYRDAAGEQGENQAFLRVYGRAGEPCGRCSSPIERRLIAQRGTWLCPRCQPRERISAARSRSALRS